MSTSIIYYYYVAAIPWVITSGSASTTIRVLLSALRNVVWDLLLVGYYSYYMSRLAKIPLYLATLWPGLWLYWISLKFPSFCDITQTCNYPSYYKYISKILGRLLNSLSKFWLWIFSQRVLLRTASPSRSPDLCSPFAEFPSNDIALDRAVEIPPTFRNCSNLIIIQNVLSVLYIGMSIYTINNRSFIIGFLFEPTGF